MQSKLLTVDKLLPALVESVKKTLQVDGDLRLTPRETWAPFYNRSKVFKIKMVEAIPAHLGPVSVIQFKVYADGKLLGVWMKRAFGDNGAVFLCFLQKPV